MTIDFSTLNARAEQEDMYLIEFGYESTILSASAASAASAIWGEDISDFPNNGFLALGDEILQYDLKTYVPQEAASAGWFRIQERGCFGTTAASAASGDTVREPYLDKKFCTSAFHADLANEHPYLKIPKGQSQEIKPGEGQSSIGNLYFEIDDHGNEFSKIASVVPMRNRRVTFKGGFAELPVASWETEWVGLVRNLALTNDHTRWKLECDDLKRHMRKELFTQIGKTKLDGAATDAQTSFTVNTTDGTGAGDIEFIDPATYEYSVYVRIDDEIIGPVTSMTGTALECGAGCRGKFNTIAVEHDDDADVEQAFLVGPVNPVTLLLQFLTSTGDGTNGSYDVLPDSQGMAAPEADIDVSGFEDERDVFLLDTYVAFYITQDESDGKRWLEKNLLRPTNATISVNRAGQLKYRICNPPILGNDPADLDNLNVIKVTSFSAGMTEIVNQVKLLYSKDPYDGEYIQTMFVVDADSISRHGESPVREIELEGVHGSLSLVGDHGGDELAASIAKWYRARFAEPVPNLKLKAFLKEREIDVGDMVMVTWDSLPNWQPNPTQALTGKGLDALVFEVTKKQPNFDRAECDLNCLGTAFSYRKFAVIGPNTLPAYTSATAAQKNYGFICSNANNKMGDGDAGYRFWAGGGGASDTDILFLCFLADAILSGIKSDDDSIYAEWNTSTGHDHDGAAGHGAPVIRLPEDATFDGNLTVKGHLVGWIPQNFLRL